MQGPDYASSSRLSDAFLSKFVRQLIIVHTYVGGDGASARSGVPQAATIYGRLESIYRDALILESVNPAKPNGGKILIYKRAIVAIEAHNAPTP